jgi:PEP-CTERM motif
MKKFLIGAVAAAGLALASQANATLYTITGGGGTANITTGVNTMTIVLTDSNANPNDETFAISGLELFLSAAPTTVSLFSQSGALINVLGGVGTSVAGSPTHWGAGSTGSTLFLQTAGTFSQGAQPEDLIVGPGPYTNANNGFKNFNPYINQVGTFVINFTGAGTPIVLGGNLAFNTSGTGFVESSCTVGCGGPPPGVPEPATWAMMLVGFGGMGALLRRRRQVMAAVA